MHIIQNVLYKMYAYHIEHITYYTEHMHIIQHILHIIQNVCISYRTYCISYSTYCISYRSYCLDFQCEQKLTLWTLFNDDDISWRCPNPRIHHYNGAWCPGYICTNRCPFIHIYNTHSELSPNIALGLWMLCLWILLVGYCGTDVINYILFRIQGYGSCCPAQETI